MRASSTHRLQDLAQQLAGELRGDAEYLVTGIAPLDTAEAGDITFFQASSLRGCLQSSQAGAVILSPESADDFSGNCIVVKNPYAAFAKIMQYLFPVARHEPGIHHSAQLDRNVQIHPEVRIDAFVKVESGVQIAAGVWLEAGVFVGADVLIGAGTHVYPGVKIYSGCRIGERCVIHAGAVIGADGFGFAEENGKYLKIPQIGGVLIGNDVEIGANTCIDRGVLTDTILADGVKIDNLVQIGHNVQIGAHTVIAGQTGIAGSTRIGSHCRIGGQVGVTGHVEIADNCVIAGQSAITHSLRSSGVYSGVVPAHEITRWRRIVARFDGLDALFRRVKTLEKKSAHQASSDGEPLHGE
ncbi:UDP-3-O-(3-hydroxymyristoyl)glucosamine N-acyltransferase [Acidithiobacillus concretivorus]|uniref:UDP-3-O-acylglucosamine N-acyltransferase n=1 Tax=Acidithiobacillus concretivorus TaxID=3063952 RepID=A0ABS5ZP66_9PROT|nr:UDP-3-O-(3-hydroxymyristoyl)glucosamine N-acyltransferase [Acidithiobacillus concretivorus]MBU2738431.1 UDP-3-O-(3-hydroxymyristoyl)glucosamine N-acyltransferase [Acidithiobacillus concretivorus]